MCGSTIKLAISALAVILISGTPFSFPVYLHFVSLQSIADVMGVSPYERQPHIERLPRVMVSPISVS